MGAYLVSFLSLYFAGKSAKHRMHGELLVTRQSRSAVLLGGTFIRAKLWLAAWLIAVALLIFADLLSSGGLGMRKRW
jgi:hypothetical protein